MWNKLKCFFLGHSRCSTTQPIRSDGSYDWVLFCCVCKKELDRDHWGHSKESHLIKPAI